MYRALLNGPVFTVITVLPITRQHKEFIIRNSSVLEEYLNKSIDTITVPERVMKILKDSGFLKIKDIFNNIRKHDFLKLKNIGETSYEIVMKQVSNDLEKYINTCSPVKAKKGRQTKEGKDVISITEGILGIACRDRADVLYKIIKNDGNLESLLNVPLRSLSLSVKNERILESARLKTVHDLSKVNSVKLAKYRGYGAKSLVELVSSLRMYFDEYLHDMSGEFRTIIEPYNLEELVKYMLSRVTKKEMEVLSRRYGLWNGRRETLVEVGNRYGITRERVRQIQQNAITKLHKLNWIRVVGRDKHTTVNDNHIHMFMKRIFDTKLEPFLRENHNIATVTELTKLIYAIGGSNIAVDLSNEFLSGVLFDGKPVFNDFVVSYSREVVGLKPASGKVYHDAVKTAKDHLAEAGNPKSLEELLDYMKASGFNKAFNIDRKRLKRYLEISPIAKDSTGKFGLRRWKYFDSYSLKSMVERALIEIGEPVHFNQITHVMNRLFPERAPFDARNIQARMGTEKDIFIWVYPGVYGLKKWGIKRIPKIQDCLYELLDLTNKSMTVDELTTKTLKRRKCNKASIYTTLTVNKDTFVKYPDGTYGLVDWG